ncbi:methylaspartate mutase [[Kitasatospora] papulosa]|uniref:methylaspartate mutase n=1 Tax=[Kitasatospora] papulosa TaxID=1464011 RepID=UPI00362BF893
MTPGFGHVVAAAHSRGQLVVQPRMGMSGPAHMRAGLLATRSAQAVTVGTLTLDSYTRVGDHAAARRAVNNGNSLNGFPIMAHGADTTRRMLSGIRNDAFPIQVRHGSADPRLIFTTLASIPIDATEGGPVSYCLPYSRMPLRESIRCWTEASRSFAQLQNAGLQPHMETFGGCMLGQMCPPSLLVAISVLEAVFFRQHGLRSISLSYAQQTNPAQDTEAISALRDLATAHLPDVDWHIVLYAYMGVYPRTSQGARLLLEEAARLAVRAGAARLIVKTVAEAHRIPTVQENVRALESAARAARQEHRRRPSGDGQQIRAEATEIVEAVLELDEDVGRALALAFERGYLDVPYCLHPDNAGRTRSFIDTEGRLQWSTTGSLPVSRVVRSGTTAHLTSGGLLSALSYVADRFDAPHQASTYDHPTKTEHRT